MLGGFWANGTRGMLSRIKKAVVLLNVPSQAYILSPVQDSKIAKIHLEAQKPSGF